MKKRREQVRSITPLLRLDADRDEPLQLQLRKRIVAAIEAGVLAPGARMPSSRKLAAELGIARNTAFLAYQHLIAEGHLESRERSGVFVRAARAGRADGYAPLVRIPGTRSSAGPSPAAAFLKADLAASRGSSCPPDWQASTFPFIEGAYDRSLFPVSEWREASRLALGVSEIDSWSVDNVDADDAMLIEEIRTKLLPRRGISAQPEEILITSGGQQAQHLLSVLFCAQGVRVGVEDPGNPAFRDLVRLSGAELERLPVDRRGVQVPEGARADRLDLVYVTPSRQRPTGVTLCAERREALVEAAERHDFLVIEDDFESEMNYLRNALPALRSLAPGRVLYTASLSRLLAPGIRLGFLVAPPDIIARARTLRNLTTKRPSPNNQRTAAHFLSLGHYDAMLARLNAVCEERLIALRDALNHYRPDSIAIPAVDGGTAYWVEGPEELDARVLAQVAEREGVLIEPVQDFFLDGTGHGNVFRLGITSLPTAAIRPGVERLCTLMRTIAGQSRPPRPRAGRWLTARELGQLLPGARLLYKTVYDDPCTIELGADGTLSGKAGLEDEDRDTGRWWIEGDRWFRQWNSWAYGEAVGFHVRLEGIVLLWLNERGERVDSAILVP